ncbi:MAG: urease accessory protein UreF [Synechococcales cyanobacterium RU_4_20]|nr:urease accessory protein UreF [Synechococcales cyanobacterium RU_4_20]
MISQSPISQSPISQSPISHLPVSQFPISTLPALLSLLQLASATLPVGAFSYSEGLETLVHSQQLTTPQQLQQWLTQELQVGAIRVEAAIMLRSYQATQSQTWEQLLAWNRWLSASRDSEELRQQSWQMGRSLLRLIQKLNPPPTLPAAILQTLRDQNCNFAIAFGLTAHHWQIPPDLALIGYLQSWATNLIAAAIKLIPLGQTVGQQLLFDLQPALEAAMRMILSLEDDQLEVCGWGLAIASMQHEIQYSRLFRS